MRGWTIAAGLALAATGCGNDGGTGPARLAPEEVAGSYAVCALAFTPTSRFLPAVDVRAKAFELSSTGVTAPALKLDATQAFELEYTPRGRFADVEHRGSFDTRESTVLLSFARPGDVVPLLLPQSVEAEWDAAARTLTVADAFAYTVSKADYEWLLGESDPGIPPRVEGRLAGRFSAGPCP